MCGRYQRRSDKQKIAEAFHLRNVRWARPRFSSGLQPRPAVHTARHYLGRSDRHAYAPHDVLALSSSLCEIVWVLRSLLKQSPTQVASHLERLHTADSLEVQNEQQVFEAVFAIKRGTGEFEDALIGALNAWAGCSHTLTFDRKAARLPYFHEIV
jgi:predicted nucleic-acid-binding protein